MDFLLCWKPQPHIRLCPSFAILQVQENGPAISSSTLDDAAVAAALAAEWVEPYDDYEDEDEEIEDFYFSSAAGVRRGTNRLITRMTTGLGFAQAAC